MKMFRDNVIIENRENRNTCMSACIWREHYKAVKNRIQGILKFTSNEERKLTTTCTEEGLHRYRVHVVCSLELVRCTRVMIFRHTYICMIDIYKQIRNLHIHPNWNTCKYSQSYHNAITNKTGKSLPPVHEEDYNRQRRRWRQRQPRLCIENASLVILNIHPPLSATIFNDRLFSALSRTPPS